MARGGRYAPVTLEARMSLAHVRHHQDPAPALQRLRDTGANYVPGRGSLTPWVVFVGEAPGAAEDRMRRPFCGPSGRMLDDLLASVGLGRDRVYVTNVVKYRPPQNRDPFPSEKAASLPHLVRELRVLGHPPVVTLGNHATRALVGEAVRAKWTLSLPLEGLRERLRVLPLYHPAVALYSATKKPLLLQEFQEVLGAVR